MAIGEALGGETTDAALPRAPTIAAAAPEAEAGGFASLVKMDDHQGKTWAEIVGAANVSKMRIATGADDTDEVDAASFAGMALTFITGSPPEVGDVADGMQFGDANYKGIDGTVFCAGTDCEVEGEAGSEMLTGSWYFTPDDGDEWYVGTTTDGVTLYAVETMYARFGHWLTVAGDPAVTTVNRFASTGAGTDTNTTGLGISTVGDDTNNLVGSATYTGPAAGMSVHKTLG